MSPSDAGAPSPATPPVTRPTLATRGANPVLAWSRGSRTRVRAWALALRSRLRAARWTPDTVAERYRSPLHDTRNAAWLGTALGITFTACFLTGLWSHLAQDPPSWFTYPARPAGLYRVTQGVHIVSGMAAIPLLLAKLWVVHHRFVQWPPARSVLHGVERLALLPLVGGAVFMLMSGAANVARWYPWSFFFPRAHFWMAWITVGALLVHVGSKATTARAAMARGGSGPMHLRWEPPPDEMPPSPDGGDRRAFLGGVAVASGALVVATAGGTIAPLSAVSVLAQRRPDVGPQGLPVNKSAAGAGVVELARDPAYRLVVEGAVPRPQALSLADLRELPQRTAELPIACVEGWSASAVWRGVPVRELLAVAGVEVGSDGDDGDDGLDDGDDGDDGLDDVAVTVESLQPRGRYRRSELNHLQLADPETLLAVELNGEPLHIDHGFPVRLIGPARPGVLQTKWVSRLVVHGDGR